MNRVKLINNLFSTADAEDVAYSSDGYELVLSFTDWQENRYTLKFEEVEYLKITEDIDFEKFRYDCPQEVLDSSLVEELKLNKECFHHYMLCFNAWSNIEIVSRVLVIQSMELAKNA
ncbi:hypothetical protein BGP78_15025 [Pseudoalteromonas sp. MSK9-3]|uniref:hypothetical protein n=1 Tax=Pseudoalteromonas sp. MSK9-3 TaxID=1897633 RepID=UPI000E6B93AA|nr:hypothetical protein [Pseudoalteromonas sp. MSK9-3]RJE76024.1 hypothetical protein BGP78_15025 [Pseudoalteromonas sp. MSK9-3]